MPRILLMLVTLVIRAGRGLRSLKDGFLLGTLYFIVLAPAAFRRKLFRRPAGKLHARGSSWLDIREEGRGSGR